MASVPTGMPAGIWTIDSRLSMPASDWVSTGTPSTGRLVIDAAMPGKCAAPPAPAITTLSPRSLAPCAYSYSRFGVRWADTTLVSWATPSCSSVSAAWRMVSQSDLLPMMIPTCGPGTASLPRVAQSGRFRKMAGCAQSGHRYGADFQASKFRLCIEVQRGFGLTK